MKQVSDLSYLILLLKWLQSIHGRKRFQKLVYLLKEKGVMDFSYVFVPHFFGPYSDALQNDINLLSSLGLINIKKSDSLYIHQLAPNGERIASRLEKEIFGRKAKSVRRQVEELSKKSIASLVAESKETMAGRLKPHIVLNLWK